MPRSRKPTPPRPARLVDPKRRVKIIKGRYDYSVGLGPGCLVDGKKAHVHIVGHTAPYLVEHLYPEVKGMKRDTPLTIIEFTPE